jgi:hypothetical protein
MEQKWILLRFTIERIGNEERLGTQPILVCMARFWVSPQLFNGEFHRVVTFLSERLKLTYPQKWLLSDRNDPFVDEVLSFVVLSCSIPMFILHCQIDEIKSHISW